MFGESTDPKERRFVDAHGPDDEAVRDGIGWLASAARSAGTNRGAIFVNTLGQVESLGRVIGDQAAKEFAKNKKLTASGVTIDLLTERGLPMSYTSGPVLGVWVDSKDMDKVEKLNPSAICAIPWSREDLAGWKADRNPTDLRTGQAGGSDQTISNPVVEAAMQSLTIRVNLSSGLGHPSDKAATVQMFRALKKAGDYNPEEIRAYAVRHGWRPDHARQLAEKGRAILDGKAIQGGKVAAWSPDAVKIWREDAAKK